jgi:hypothetical protein
MTNSYVSLPEGNIIYGLVIHTFDHICRFEHTNMYKSRPQTTQNMPTSQKAFPALRMLWANSGCRDTQYEH